MELKDVKVIARLLYNLSSELLQDENAEPCVKANAEAIAAHARLLCNELALDIES